jgi:NAD(P)-dependent dehydrogenase (short-subunit alcohol dehydrogenase family)
MREDDTTASMRGQTQMGRLDEKVALITGAAGGIGRVAAELFAREGARVVVADVVEDDGKSTVDAIRDAGGDAAFVKADVSDAAAAEAMVRFTLDTFGGLHVLYNNAGILPPDDAGTLDTPESTWERVMAVNLKGVWLGCKHALPHLRAAGGGSIVNLASMHAFRTMPGSFPYAAAKGGVVSLTKSLAIDAGPARVRVNAICPGTIETRLTTDWIAAQPDPAAAKKRFLAAIPLGRLGTPEDVAALALFLASDESSFLSGAALPLDGGRDALSASAVSG